MLKGKIAYLSPLLETDKEILFEWINDRELVLSSSHYRPIHHATHLEWFNAIQHQSDVVIFGIRRIDDDSLAGTCQLHSINPVYRSAELQIRIGRKDAWGIGIGTDATSLLLRYAFNDLNLSRVYLHVFESNKRAIHIYTRTGFKVEGTLKNSAFVDGRYVDVLIMAILRAEWSAP